MTVPERLWLKHFKHTNKNGKEMWLNMHTASTIARWQHLIGKQSDSAEHQLRKYVFLAYRVFQKSSPFKTFWNMFTLVKSFCMKFCKFVGNSYPHISNNFCRFILIFRFYSVEFGVFTHKKKMPWQVSHWLVYAERLSQCGRLDCRVQTF